MTDPINLREIERCCLAWEPGARLIGNVTRDELLALVAAVRAAKELLKDPDDMCDADWIEARKALGAITDEETLSPEARAALDAEARDYHDRLNTKEPDGQG